MTLRRAILVCVFALVGCASSEQWYETDVDLMRFDIVREDDQGLPMSADVEVSYEECPGFQREVVRGGAAFARCMKQHKVGDRLAAKIRWYKGDRGYYESRIYKLGECERPPDPADEASFITVRDCSDWVVNGTNVGFQCQYLDKTRLNAKCPWFRRR